MDVAPVRLLRTSSSERFALRRGESDVAVLDIHYLASGRVQATLIAFEGLLAEDEIPTLLTFLDENLLPDVTVEDGLVFTVVTGRILGAFSATPDPAEIAIRDENE